MKAVEKLIGDLLLRNNCVVIPTFGGFITNQTSAVIDYKNGTMFPPRKSVLFNRQLINNDGLLIKEYSEDQVISYQEAQQKINAVVAEWTAILDAGERINIDRVGYLFLDAERNIGFEQDRFFNLLLESYGLGKVHFITEEDVKIIQHQEEVISISESENPIFTVETSKIEILENQEEKHIVIEHPALKRKIKVWKYVAAAILIPIGFYSFWIPMHSNVLESGILSIKDFNLSYKQQEGIYKIHPINYKKESIQKHETIHEIIDKVSSDAPSVSYKMADDIYINVKITPKNNGISSQEEIVVIPSVAEEKTKPVEVKKVIEPIVSSSLQDFEAVVGSFGSEENAKILINQLKSKGFKAKLIGKVNNLYRVSAGGSTSKEEVNKIINDLKTIGVNGWLLKK